MRGQAGIILVTSSISAQQNLLSGIPTAHYRSQAWRRNGYPVVVLAQSTMPVRQLATQGQILCNHNIKLEVQQNRSLFTHLHGAHRRLLSRAVKCMDADQLRFGAVNKLNTLSL
jgi:hypothetical protein